MMPTELSAIIAAKATRSPAAIPCPRAYSQVPAAAAIGVAAKNTALVQFTERNAGPHSMPSKLATLGHGIVRAQKQGPGQRGGRQLVQVPTALAFDSMIAPSGCAVRGSARRDSRTCA